MYLVILVIIGSLFFKTEAPIANCSDRLKNQNETGVDCGGACASCEIQKAKEITTEGDIKVLNTGTVQALLAKIKNPNDNLIAERIEYEFSVTDDFGVAVERIRGRESLNPNEMKTLMEVGTYKKGEISFTILNVAWKEKIEGSVLRKEPFTFGDFSATENENGELELHGSIHNTTGVPVRNAELKVLLVNNLGTPVAGTKTVLTEIPSFRQTPFVVLFGEGIQKEELNVSSTRVFVSF